MNQKPNLVANPPQKKPSVLLRAVLPAVMILVLSAVGILYGQRVIDRVKSSMYTPSTQIAGITERLRLTTRGKDVLYVTDPTIDTKEQFNVHCKSEERTTAILGCYYRDNIYLFDIKNDKLDGTLEVTAAHEMLHAAYQRLNFFERQRVDTMIEAQYAKLKDNASLKEIMQYYQKAEPGAEINELHSILGTTIATLDPELEQYYSQYFTDRAHVVALNEAYNKVFADIKQQAEVLEARIKQLQPQLTADLASYESDRKQVELDIESFNQQAVSGSFASRAAFNATRSALVARVDALNARRDAVNATVSSYNDDVAALNKLSIQVDDLYKSINGAESTAGV